MGGNLLMKVKVQYATMIVSDLEKSTAFYRDLMGFVPGYHVDLPNGARITIMQSEGAAVELIESSDYPLGLYSVGTDVNDLDGMIEQLEDQGYQITGSVVTTTVGRQAFVLDPDGNRICLIEHSDQYRNMYMK